MSMPASHYLSACLCFKNAAPYVGEWLAFYSALGVEHFYLYNNESTDRYAPVIAPYLDAGAATLVQYPGRGVQQEVYTHCLHAFGRRTRWMIFCDDDEFLFPVEDVPLPLVLMPYERFAGLAVNWML